MWVYKENFYPSFIGSEDSALRPHLGMCGHDTVTYQGVLTMESGHCIEDLREYFMCNPPFNVNLFEWKEDSHKAYSANFIKLLTPVSQPRTCVNWEEVKKWSQSRHAGLSPSVLKPIDIN